MPSSTSTVVRLASACLAASLLAGFSGAVAAAEFTGRGLYKFKSGSGCPFAALVPDGECNRIALDGADTVATLDEAARTIRFVDTRAYDEKTVVADVVLQGSGRMLGGGRVPLTLHAVLSRSGTRWSINSHAHAPVAGNFTDIAIDPYRVIVNDGGKGERVILTPTQIDKTVSSPSLAARLVNALIQVRDNRAATDGSPDITVALGLGRASTPVIRAKLEVPHDGAGSRLSLEQVLAGGNWAFELQALSSRLPRDVVRRELFLYGLDTLAAVQPLMQGRWPEYGTLRVGAVNGKGFVAHGDRRMDFADADRAARTFLQSSFVGLILGWQQQPMAADRPR